jgi:hypothetical protein
VIAGECRGVVRVCGMGEVWFVSRGARGSGY